MPERALLSQQFSQHLAAEGFPVALIEQDMQQTGDPKRVIRNWTSFPDTVVSEGLWDEDRDEILPMIKTSLKARLQPWRENGVEAGLPMITLVEVARDLRDQELLNRQRTISPERIARVITKYPVKFNIHGSVYTTDISIPEFPKNTLLDMTSGRQYDVSPKKIAKLGRHPRYTHGSRTIEKSRLDPNTINSAIRREAIAKAEISFRPLAESVEGLGLGVMSELSSSIVDKTEKGSVEEIFYSQPNGHDLMKTFEWLRRNGFGRNWILGNSESLLAKSLVRFSQGEPTDFVIWNCIGFKWFASQNGEFPTCNITNNFDAAISLYFKDKIETIATLLSTIGNPQITILVPSNEALDEQVWQYRQENDEREIILTQVVEGLTQSFKDLPLPDNASLKIMRWDNYLNSCNAQKSAQAYSREGKKRISESTNFKKILQEAIKSGRNYLSESGINNVPDEVVVEAQLGYYGVYAGEGVAFNELQENGRKIIVVNFEEMRVSQLAFLGATGNLPIITPINGKEMVEYYQWEARQIQKRL